MPPSELQSQMAWYEAALGRTVQIAAKTKLKMNGKPQVSEVTNDSSVATPYPPGLNSSYAPQAVYNPQIAAPPCEIPAQSEIMMQSDAVITHQPQFMMMDPQLSDMGPSQQNFFPGEQSQIGGMAGLSNVENSTSHEMIGGDWNGAHHMQQQPGGQVDFDYDCLQQRYPPEFPNLLDSDMNLWQGH